ncbi:hypothetical protein HK405_001084 [Cladochytrium tenue]|nr:hypothetical protein HK405_001084 [Cladochytrium tenue]
MSLLLAILGLLFLVGIVNSTFLLALYGSVVAWVYIRFFKVQEGIRGDRSESFSFASFFPESTQFTSYASPTLAAASLSSPPPPAAKPLPGSDLADAERRRAIALRALDLRLQGKDADHAPAELESKQS